VVNTPFLPAVISLHRAGLYRAPRSLEGPVWFGLERPYTPKQIVQRLLVSAFNHRCICALSLWCLLWQMGWLRTGLPEHGRANHALRC